MHKRENARIDLQIVTHHLLNMQVTLKHVGYLKIGRIKMKWLVELIWIKCVMVGEKSN